jgi:hypothetical protein
MGRREDKTTGVACGDGLPSRREGQEQVGSSRDMHEVRQRQGDAAASRCVALRVAASRRHQFDFS